MLLLLFTIFLYDYWILNLKSLYQKKQKIAVSLTIDSNRLCRL